MSRFPQNRLIISRICTAGQDVKQKIEGEINEEKLVIRMKRDMQEMPSYFRHL